MFSIVFGLHGDCVTTMSSKTKKFAIAGAVVEPPFSSDSTVGFSTLAQIGTNSFSRWIQSRVIAILHTGKIVHVGGLIGIEGVHSVALHHRYG